VSKDLSSEKCMQLASKWIKDCQENHSGCKQPPSTLLPSRVIDVGSDGRDPFLFETGGNTEGQYVTLSHCWGKVRPLTTTLATLDDRKKEIPFDLFPKTFQDAILITRNLGVQYLWIDSLCIIQNSSIDWQAESAKMAEIYQGSVFTIAATSAKDGREGCFVEKERWRESVAVQVHDADGNPTTVFVREAHPRNHEIGQNFVFPYEPLSLRSWVLQERLLSTRVLMYTSCELLFECKSDLYCECGDFPLHRSYGASMDRIRFADDDQKSVLAGWREDFARYLAKLAQAFPAPLSGFANLLGERVVDGYLPNRPSSFVYWKDLVKQYTVRKLTYDRDVLPALSGLASLVQRGVADDYLAGLWRDDLPVALLWSHARPSWTLNSECFALLQNNPSDERIPVDVEPYLPRRTAEACAPTWSWASIRGATDYDGKWLDRRRRLVQPARVLGATCNPSSSNPTGSVQNGSIVLSAPLAPIRLGFHEWHRESLCHRCRVADYTCNINHEHIDSCINWNLDDWAVLDLPPADPSTLIEQDCWRVRIGLKPPIHNITFSDYSGRLLLSRLPDEVSRTYTICYHLLLTKSKQKGDSFERLGLYIKLVPHGQSYDGGAVRNIEIL
jgi:Heterokaryon incompatibility protein (HET)